MVSFQYIRPSDLKSDRGDLQDHYWSYFTVILKGGYWETRENGVFWGSRLYGV